jgi:hypothetical protein
MQQHEKTKYTIIISYFNVISDICSGGKGFFDHLFMLSKILKGDHSSLPFVIEFESMNSYQF